MALADDLKTDIVYPAFMFDFFLDSFPLHFWTGVGTVVVDGATYVPLPGIDAGIAAIEALDITALANSMTLAGLQEEIIAVALGENFQNSVARVWIAALDIDHNFKSREMIFDGFIENMPINQEPEGESVLEIEMTHVMASLFEPFPINYTKADQAKFDPTDTFFNFIPKD